MNDKILRQVVLDTETTGMSKDKPHYKGHRIIEIAAVEIVNRRLTNHFFHVYLNPSRNIDSEAFSIHGISEHFLYDKPKFSEISNDFLNFVSGSELIVHNALFDIGFIDYEFSMLTNNVEKITSFCNVIDTLQLARRLFPGKRNSLNALCERYYIDNSARRVHSALIDARLLAQVFLSMTGGQIQMFFMNDHPEICDMEYYDVDKNKLCDISSSNCIQLPMIRVIYANKFEVELHERYLNILEKNSSQGVCIWRNKKYIVVNRSNS
ncbi:DNA polymerase III subunit epsilon [Blochmannia endosymbiont of Polyrhachis (Hedomyrma) turneri]|uniref:DNA polymerase III subunit epsilon n=1 Tax=Blochmannia endosymbiont of Polyrhachis (Hedomyrma) turneri TaxID=1505596 RepID=UPI00061A7FE4|nr:DNA polymerase III subunit epsilon [Blochmannia endosymbiont of Polyrhachis (Hedomyrma) turneri]AKC59801.1 DNA polymerase III subunit epsilon [Blochmannia endosymbiont of Polyrhachis (Hedomyrma) turneri]